MIHYLINLLEFLNNAYPAAFEQVKLEDNAYLLPLAYIAAFLKVFIQPLSPIFVPLYVGYMILTVIKKHYF